MHKSLSLLISSCVLVAVLPVVANAAGTYYTGSMYQPAQYRYGQTGTYATTNGYYNRAGNVVYQGTNTTQNTTQSTTKKQQKSSKNGLFLNAGVSHENAMWKYDMKTAGSILHYDNLEWNVFDLNGGYVFDLGKTKMQIDAGFKYGMQWGETSMIDDDISNGGIGVYEYYDELGAFVGAVEGHAFSVGASKDGTMLGFNAGFGLTDFLKLGNIKITPSIGYRYLQYKLETQNNYGIEIYTVNGISGCDGTGGESVCGVALLFYQNETDTIPSAIIPSNSLINIGGLTSYYLDTTDTHYFTQSGTSHSYEVEWSGPYLALDMLYDINENNRVNGRIELGFPGYTSTGDQPYRWDWAHPKSVEDKAGMFSALHVGMLANWTTAITNSVALLFGVTYDYYTVSGADATTYLNKRLYDQLAAKDSRTDIEERQMLYLQNANQNCGGWTCKASKEIDSTYKSMGIRVGINARF